MHHPVCKACLGHVEVAGAAHVAKADARKISVLRPLRIVKAEVCAGDPHPIVARCLQGLLELIDFAWRLARHQRFQQRVAPTGPARIAQQDVARAHLSSVGFFGRKHRGADAGCEMLVLAGPHCVTANRRDVRPGFFGRAKQLCGVDTGLCTAVTALLAHGEQSELHQPIGFGRVCPRERPQSHPRPRAGEVVSRATGSREHARRPDVILVVGCRFMLHLSAEGAGRGQPHVAGLSVHREGGIGISVALIGKSAAMDLH